MGSTCIATGSCSHEGHDFSSTGTETLLQWILPAGKGLPTLVFVSFSTAVYTLVLLTVLYFWWANRQFHFKKRQKDGSRLSMVATHKDAMQFRALQKQRQRELRQGVTNYDNDSSDSETSSLSDEGDQKEIEEQDLSDYETDTEEPALISPSDTAKKNIQFLASVPPEKRQAVKDLTAVVSNMEVFSYLSQEAFVQCLEYMEYVDLKENQLLFHQGNMDGSLYAVLDGQVKCQFNNSVPREEDDDQDGEPFISFTAGNGDVVTSLLSMLAGLVRQCQERNGVSPSLRTTLVPRGMSVTAIGVAPSTKLVRVPPHCFMKMLDDHPHDVQRIAQTIIARLQRVTLQTVVRCLGLQKEIVRRNPTQGRVGSPDDKVLPETWERLDAVLANFISDVASLEENVQRDAAEVAAATIMGSFEAQNMQSDNMKAVLERLKEDSSILSLPPGETLITAGESNDSLYLVLRGTLDVGMHLMGASPLLKQSNRRASVHPQGLRRSIFPQLQSTRTVGDRQQQARRRQTGDADDNANSFSRIYQAMVGEFVGNLSCFTGDASIVTVKNASQWEPAIVYKISREAYCQFVAKYPSALTECLGSILDRLGSPIVCLLDWNVEWMHVKAGEDVVNRGDSCDSMYAVLNGRLRARAVTSGPFHTRKNSPKSTGSPAPPGIPKPQTIEATVSGELRKGLLLRATENLNNRRLARSMKNKPKVAIARPPPSRRRDTTAEEIPGEEFGRGSLIGEIEILTGADWPLDIYASRHSELARVPVSVLNAIIRMCPRAGLHLARVVASQIQKKNARSHNRSAFGGPRLHFPGESPSKNASPAPPLGTLDARSLMPSYGLSLATIAVVPLLDGDFDLDGFCAVLKNTLHHNIAPTALMTKAYARSELGEEVFRQRNAMHTLKLTRLCGDMEEKTRLVLYQADCNYTWWTRLCIQQADCILLVVRAEEAPPQKKVEACLSWAFSAMNAKLQLVVLQNSQQYHDDGNDDELEAENAYETMESSDALNDWSEQRYWIAGHHLIRTPFRKNVQDFKRLCRRVSGRSIGLVLGGGGARGLAHIGVIRALQEAGITVDFVGGTSQGAYIGALFAKNPDDFDALVQATRQMADSMSNVMEKLRDLTLPLVSFFSGYRFNRGIQKSLGRCRIQDLICNFFCVSVDLRNNMQVVHTKGVCWRYVRASMTLQSYLPPLSEDGMLLVDGGYMNVLPADVMKRQMRARTVIAVDVSEEVVLDNYEYGSHLNGWWLLWNSWNPFIKTVKIPSMGDISERLAWVNGDVQKRKVKEDIDLFLQPPVANYGVLEFDKFDEIVQIGYDHAKPKVDNFVRKYPHLVS